MPLNVPRKSDGWDGFRDMVAFPAEDRDTGTLVGCAIAEEALRDHFLAELGNITSLLGTFRHHRETIERIASDKYDAQGKPGFVVLLSSDFPGAQRSVFPMPDAIDRRRPAEAEALSRIAL